MLISSCQKLRNNDLRVTVDGKQLSRVSSVKYLGLHLDKHLTWHHHIQQTFFKEFTQGYTVYIVYAPCLLLCFLTCTVFLCYPYWIIVMWTPSFVQHFKRLERLHSKFNSPFSRTNPTVCVTLTEIQIYKVLHHLSPPYLHGTFHYAVDITGHASWNIHHLFVLRVQTTLVKYSFYFPGSQLWNTLNPVLYEARKLEQFKTVYKTLSM